MTKFNPENKELLTFGEQLGPAMRITEQADADQYLKDYTAHIQRGLDKKPNRDGKTALEIAKINLGYYAGYYDDATIERVNRLFNTTHPILGDLIKAIAHDEWRHARANVRRFFKNKP